MKIAVCSIGFEGDVRPYIALAQRLRSAEFDAQLVAADGFAERARTAGVPFHSTHQPFDPDAYRRDMKRVLAERNSLGQLRLIMELTATGFLGAVAGVLEATCDADLIIHHQIDVPARADRLDRCRAAAAIAERAR